METLLTAIQNTPLPTILILAGLLFLLLGFVTKLGGIIEVSPEQKRLTIPIGLLVLTIGLLLNFIRPNTPINERGETEVEAKTKAEAEAKTKAEAEAKMKAEAEAEAEAKEKDAVNRTRWPSYNFPPPNGGLLVFTIMPDGNPACASYDGAHCLWGNAYDQIDFGRLKPLVCGEGHRTRWGVTGYEDPKHWCNLAKTLRDNPR